MKKAIVTTTLILVSFLNYAQVTMQKTTYEDTQDIKRYAKVRNGTLTNEYITQRGTSIKIGDTIYIGIPTSSEGYTRGRAATLGGNGRYNTGAARTSNSAKFQTLTYGKPASFGNVLLMMNGDAPLKPGTEMMGEMVIVKKMALRHKGSKKKPLGVEVLFGEPNGRAFGMNKYISSSDVEKAIMMGEIVPGNVPLSREDAIAKLKEAKDLLDLEMMNEEEYKKLREQLAPIIMGS